MTIAAVSGFGRPPVCTVGGVDFHLVQGVGDVPDFYATPVTIGMAHGHQAYHNEFVAACSGISPQSPIFSSANGRARGSIAVGPDLRPRLIGRGFEVAGISSEVYATGLTAFRGAVVFSTPRIGPGPRFHESVNLPIQDCPFVFRVQCGALLAHPEMLVAMAEWLHATGGGVDVRLLSAAEMILATEQHPTSFDPEARYFVSGESLMHPWGITGSDQSEHVFGALAFTAPPLSGPPV